MQSMAAARDDCCRKTFAIQDDHAKLCAFNKNIVSNYGHRHTVHKLFPILSRLLHIGRKVKHVETFKWSYHVPNYEAYERVRATLRKQDISLNRFLRTMPLLRYFSFSHQIQNKQILGWQVNRFWFHELHLQELFGHPVHLVQIKISRVKKLETKFLTANLIRCHARLLASFRVLGKVIRIARIFKYLTS